MKIVFFGTPDFSVPSLRRIAKEHEVVAVVTQPDRPRNRGKVTFSPVKSAAIELELQVCQPDKIRLENPDMISHGADMGITAAYGQILPQTLLDAFPHGIINVHASLLPKYRGSSPIQWAVINGEKRTGITIMQTALGVDSGDILAQAETEIGEYETAGELFDRLSLLAPDLLSETVNRIASGTEQRLAQDAQSATYFPMLTKDIGRIDWTRSANELCNLVRGLAPKPTAYAVIGGEQFKIYAARVSDKTGEAGTVLFADAADGLTVACGAGALRLVTLQAPGGRAMADTDYLRGHAVTVGKKLC